MEKIKTTGAERQLIRELHRQEQLVEYYKDTVYDGGSSRAAKRRAAKAMKKYEEQVAKITASRVGRR